MPVNTVKFLFSLLIFLNEGNIVYTMKEFLKLIEQKGIKLSRGGLSLAFKKPESNIYILRCGN